MRQQGRDGLRGLHGGSCHGWPLAADATCATVARRVFRAAVAEVGLQPDLMEDCILMASELAANTLHARAVAGTGGGGDRLVSVAPDMGGEPISSAGPAPQIPQTPPAGCPQLWLYPPRPRHPPERRCQGFPPPPRRPPRPPPPG